LPLCLFEQNTAVESLERQLDKCVALPLDFCDAIKKKDDFREKVAVVQFLTAVTSFCSSGGLCNRRRSQQFTDAAGMPAARPPESHPPFSEHHS
jgi:hypothetical protein